MTDLSSSPNLEEGNEEDRSLSHIRGLAVLWNMRKKRDISIFSFVIMRSKSSVYIF